MATLTNAELLTALTGHRCPEAPATGPGLRFAFYGRMSTSTFQDVQTPHAWRRAVSDELIDGIGSVVAEFFDVGVSRRWSWQDRPEAAALLAVAAHPDRDFKNPTSHRAVDYDDPIVASEVVLLADLLLRLLDQVQDRLR